MVFAENYLLNVNVCKHCLRIIRNAYHKMKQFRISFSCKDENFQIYVCKVYIRPLLEYSPQIWSSQITDIDTIENVQFFFTNVPYMFWNVPYMPRLQMLNIESLEVRRVYNDIVFFLQNSLRLNRSWFYELFFIMLK